VYNRQAGVAPTQYGPLLSHHSLAHLPVTFRRKNGREKSLLARYNLFHLNESQQLEFTEALLPLTLSPSDAAHSNYSAAVAAGESSLDRSVSTAEFERMDAWLSSQSSAAITRVIHRGTGWGRIHELLRNRDQPSPPPPLTQGLRFEGEWGAAEAPFAEVLRDETFSAATLSSDLPPAGWMVRPACPFV